MTSIFSNTRLAFLVGEKPPVSPTASRAVAVRENLYDDSVPATPPRNNRTALKACWLVGALLTVLIPTVARNARMNNDQNSAWRSIAQKYNQMQQGQGYVYEDGAEEGDEGRIVQYNDVNHCTWWKMGCQPYYVDDKGDRVTAEDMQQAQYELASQQYEEQVQNAQANYEQYVNNQANGQPYWYNNKYFQGNTYGRQQDEYSTSSSLKFVYVWQMIMFAGIVSYGYKIIHTHSSPAMLIGGLIVWFQFNFLAMFLLSDGSIITEEEVIRLTGFYGQFSVLMFMTNAWYAVYGLIFAFVFAYLESKAQQETKAAETAAAVSDETVGDYKPMDGSTAEATSRKNDGDADDYVKVV